MRGIKQKAPENASGAALLSRPAIVARLECLLDHRTRSLERALKHLDVARQHGGHACWRAFFGVGNDRAEVCQLLGHFRVGQGLVEGHGQFRLNVSGHGLGAENAVPAGNLEVAQACFLGGWNVGQRWRAFWRGDGQTLHIARLDLRGEVGDLVAHEVNLSGDEIIQCRACALVGHFIDLGDARNGLEQARRW